MKEEHSNGNGKSLNQIEAQCTERKCKRQNYKADIRLYCERPRLFPKCHELYFKYLCAKIES